MKTSKGDSRRACNLINPLCMEGISRWTAVYGGSYYMYSGKKYINIRRKKKRSVLMRTTGILLAYLRTRVLLPRHSEGVVLLPRHSEGVRKKIKPSLKYTTSKFPIVCRYEAAHRYHLNGSSKFPIVYDIIGQTDK